MKYTEHKELAERLHAEAEEVLRRAGGLTGDHEYAFEGMDMDELAEFVRLCKMARKHYEIYQGVCTRMRNRADRKRQAELDARLAQE